MVAKALRSTLWVDWPVNAIAPASRASDIADVCASDSATKADTP